MYALYTSMIKFRDIPLAISSVLYCKFMPIMYIEFDKYTPNSKKRKKIFCQAVIKL